MEFTALRDMVASGDQEATYYNQKPGKGCFTSLWVWAVVVLVAAFVAAAVGVGVYFLHPDRKVAVEEGTTIINMDTTTSMMISTVEPEPINIRLPSNLWATRYDVRIRPDIYSNDPRDFHFNGTVNMYLQVLEPTKDITFHYNNIQITHHHVGLFGGEVLEVVNTSVDVERMFGILHLRETVMTGEEIVVTFVYSGLIDADLTGLYYASYNTQGQERFLLTSMLHPIHARKVFPCLDEPARKAKFNVIIERQNHYYTMFNTDINKTETLFDNWVADYYTETPKMSTYLLAFLVSDFICQNTSSEYGTNIEVCSRPNAIEQTDFALSLVGGLQTWYETYFDIRFPLPKMAHVAVPNFAAGAMENWGLVFYRETNLLYDPQSSSANSKQRVPTVTAHELAHQWFGNLVTPEWWDDTWLNEGFASWMEVPCADSQLPDWRLEDQFVVSEMQVVMRVDGLASSHPVYQPINSPEEIDAIFDSITYTKGAAMVRMMYYFLGNDIFQQGLTNYLNDKAYDVAHHDDLFRALTAEANKQGKDLNVTEIMYPWIRQMGFPAILLVYNKADGIVKVSQTHFLLDRSETPEPSPYGYVWDVPVSLVTNRDTDWQNPREEWLKTKTGEITGVEKNADWILGNVGERYFYRVNYDNDTWNAIINQLNIDHEAIRMPESRAQIIDDSFNLGRSYDIDQLIGMRGTEYLDKEAEFVPWVSAKENLNYVDMMLMLSPSYGYLKKYMQSKTAPQHDQLGWNDNPVSDSHIEQKQRSLILDLACHYGLKSCLDNATLNFNAWMAAHENHDSNPISINLRQSAYCYGIANGGGEEWDFVFARYSESNAAGERTSFQEALACAQEPYLLNGYLEMALYGTVIPPQDFYNIIIYVSQNPIGKALAWTFFRANWDEIFKSFGGVLFALPRMVSGITSSFSTEWELYELETFMMDNPDQGSAALAFQQAVESTKINIAWRNTNEENITEWLRTKSV